MKTKEGLEYKIQPITHEDVYDESGKVRKGKEWIERELKELAIEPNKMNYITFVAISKNGETVLGGASVNLNEKSLTDKLKVEGKKCIISEYIKVHEDYRGVENGVTENIRKTRDKTLGEIGYDFLISKELTEKNKKSIPKYLEGKRAFFTRDSKVYICLNDKILDEEFDKIKEKHGGMTPDEYLNLQENKVQKNQAQGGGTTSKYSGLHR